VFRHVRTTTPNIYTVYWYLLDSFNRYFRSSILSLSGMWHLESEELERLHSLASSPAFPPHFQTAVALLLSCAQLKSGVEATAMPSEENAAAAGMQ
jgi:hypothetical protein